MKSLLLLASLLLSFNVLAGQDKGNGGDTCERIMRNITNDIELWLLKDEFKGIKLLNSITEDQYKEEMLYAIKRSILSCTTDKIFVGTAEKTCKNFEDKAGNIQVICNFGRFTKTEDEEKYKLMHHEFAGVAGFETNNGNEKSNYTISNQISEFLQVKEILFLGIKKVTANKCDNSGVKYENVSYVDKNEQYEIQSMAKFLRSTGDFKSVTICESSEYNFILVEDKRGVKYTFEGFLKDYTLVKDELVLLDGISLARVINVDSSNRMIILQNGDARANVDRSRVSKIISTNCNLNGICKKQKGLLYKRTEVVVEYIFENNKVIVTTDDNGGRAVVSAFDLTTLNH